MSRIVSGAERLIFSHRVLILLLLLGVTGFMGYHALQLRMDAGFKKMLPGAHDYIKTLERYEDDFGSGNQLIVALMQRQGTIFNPKFFEALKQATNEVFFLPGVARQTVTSLFTPQVIYVGVIEDGFEGGKVIPADFQPTEDSLAVVRDNIIKSGRLGSLVANDFSGALIRAQLLDTDPTTGQPLDYQLIASDLETKIRAKFETDAINVRIIGFVKSTGDIAEGARDVVTFFGITFVVTAILLWLYSGTLKLTVPPLLSALVAVIWQMGLLPLLGYGLDPMSILVPFLVFAIGVSHGVQMISGWMGEVMYGGDTDAQDHPVVPAPSTPHGVDGMDAAKRTFRRLLVPGSLALVSDLVGFITVLLIDIGIIQEMAIAASLGIAAIIFTNLILLPILLSFVKINDIAAYRARHQAASARMDPLWRMFAKLTNTGPSLVTLTIVAALTVWGVYAQRDLKIGDSEAGVPELRQESRYNVDSNIISSKFSIGVDKLGVIVETQGSGGACIDYTVMTEMERFAWYARNLPGVQSVSSLVGSMKVIFAANNEGSPRWFALSRDPMNMSATMYHLIDSAQEYMNADCSVMPVYIYTVDHKVETIDRIIAGIQAFEPTLPKESFNLRLATDNVGIIAATNDTVEATQVPIMVWVYATVIIFTWITFRSIGGTLCVILPLAFVSLLCYALMAIMDIGLKVNTLPVVALGVGVGVDYAIYIYSRMSDFMETGDSLNEAFYKAMRLTGKPVVFTGLTLGIGVCTWIFAPLKFQADMGILLTFLFLANVLGAIVILPALARWLLRGKIVSSNMV